MANQTMRSRIRFLTLMGAISLAAVASIAFLDINRAVEFEGYFGALNPALAATIATVSGVLALWYLHRRHGFAITREWPPALSLIPVAAAVTLLAILMILVDIAMPFAKDLHIPLPWGMLFYPAMGMVAESCFHLIPMAVLLGALSRSAANPGRDTSGASIVIFAFVAVASIEPIFQVSAGLIAQQVTWRDACVGLLVFAFNLVQLYVFRRFGFVEMLAMRMVYYLWWHLVWGQIRVGFLFP